MGRKHLRCAECEELDRHFTKERECRACYMKNYRDRNVQYLKYQRDYVNKMRADVITKYGGKCACCGEPNYKFLCLDHINGGGNQQRKIVAAGYNFYLWLRRNKYPKGIQVLCHNCNSAKAYYGTCPHKDI